jgi:signal transduction histidine kinase
VGAFEPAAVIDQAARGIAGPDSQVRVWAIEPGGQRLYGAGPFSTGGDPAQHPGVVQAWRGEAGAAYIPTHGSEHVVAYAPVDIVGWALLIEEPWEAVENPLLRRTQLAPLFLIPVLAFALLLVWLGFRRIVDPLRALAAQSRDLGRGQYAAIEQPVGGIAEIQHLQSELVRMARQLQAAEHSLRGYANMVVHGQEDERRRLARELHDQTIQSLIALDQRAQMAQGAVHQAAPQSVERLAEIRRMIAELLEDVRRVIRALRPIYLEDLGLLPALEMLTHDLERTAGLQARFAVQGTPVRLPAEREIAVYRLAQESLSNVARHARATRADVTVSFSPGEFVLRVQDDGQGFDPPEVPGRHAAAGHFGLLGMHERAELAGGRLGVNSAPGRGTSVTLHLPL